MPCPSSTCYKGYQSNRNYTGLPNTVRFYEPSTTPISFSRLNMNTDKLFNQETVLVVIGAEVALAMIAPVSGFGTFGTALLGGSVGCFVYKQLNKTAEGGSYKVGDALMSASPAGLGAVAGYAYASDPHRGAMIGAALVPFVFNLFNIDLTIFGPQA